jgi:hypothetical protein
MRISHRIITILVICWIPFCCCSIKAMASMMSGEDGAAAVKTSCCTTLECDSSENGSNEDPDGSKGCAGCCDRFAPEGAERDPLPAVDEIGSKQLICPMPPCSEVKTDPIGFQRAEVRPPDPPPSSLLELNCQLQI